MKEKIHPKYGKSIVRCVCGETFETGSIKGELKVEICSKCHPFYTGKQKMVDSGLPGLSFFGLLEDVCQSLDCPVDLIDTRDVIPGSAIEREIQRTGTIIYEQ